jgi:nucleotidyltransferase/DNA polymerase involved in DNA repair
MLERTMVLWIRDARSKSNDVAVLRIFAEALSIVRQRCPFVEPVRLGVMALPVRSVARFFGGELAVCDLLRDDLAELLEHHAMELHIGIADGLFAAVLAASHEELVAAGETPSFLARQAIERLHRPEIAELCQRLGIRTLGAFAKLDEDRVLERFGLDAVHCHRVARGVEPELVGVRDPDIIKRLHLLEAPEIATTQVGFFGGTSARDERAQRIAIRLQSHFGASSVQVALDKPGRDPAERAIFDAFAAEQQTVLHDSAPWPARLPTPSPMTIFTRPRDIQLLDEFDQAIGIDGAGLLSATPATYRDGGSRYGIAAWAGPWPVTGPWWRQQQRKNRLQILTSSGCAVLASHDGQGWKLVGRYD